MYTKQDILNEFANYDIYAITDRSCKDDIEGIIVVENSKVVSEFDAYRNDRYNLVGAIIEHSDFEEYAFIVADNGGAIHKLN